MSALPALDDPLRQARANDAKATLRNSLQERLSRARGLYERDGSEANYRALLEAQRAWDRLRIEELVAENRGWRQLFQRVMGKVNAAKAAQAMGEG